MGQLVTQSLAGRRYPAQMSVCEGGGAEPVAKRVLVNGVIEAGADAYGYRAACAW
ncbi:MAG: hypothetical protein IPP47_26825 [Bryobacterales bacterium]|nr:hypothetical protein [Bryobacterales bacterium]